MVHNFDEIIGSSSGLLFVIDKVRRVAHTNTSVLLFGETGTGKELIARAIHSSSQRRDEPFIKVNCAALPTGLIESELFGHERGAFSGALQRRIGRFELANTGTIFLDEIGEVPLDVQVKLLRVLQEREFERVGGNQTIKTDVRVIASTNRDLTKAIRDGAFRTDLFYRLNVFPITLPALRDRVEDIPMLTQYFVQKYAPKVGRRVEGIEPDTIARLTRYTWPGNIRELENLVERGLILNSAAQLRIELDALPELPKDATDVSLSSTYNWPPGSDLNGVQREHILSVLNATAWVVEGDRGAAKQLGLKAATLRHRMKKLGITRESLN